MRALKAFSPALVAACLLVAACGDSQVPGPAAPAGTSAPPAARPLDGFQWEPDELLPLPGEAAVQPGHGDTWLEGVVEDPEGNPVPGARVSVDALPFGTSSALPIQHASATAGPDGRFRVGPGPAPWSGNGVLHAWAPGFARTSLVSRTMAGPGEPWSEPGEDLRIRLRPGIPVKGEVRCEDGGAPDAPVGIWVVGAHLFSLVLTTDASGAFTFTAPEGPLTVTAVDGAHPASRSVLEVEPGVDNFVQVTVRRGRDVPVRVLDAETGKPVKGAFIRTYYGRTTMEAVPDDGRFLLRKYWFSAFQARAPGYAARFNYIPADAGTPENPEMEVRLQPGFVARGRVLDLEGRPLEGVRVRCYAKDSGGEWVDIIGGTSRADGSWTFVGLPVPGAGKEIRVFALAPGCGYACSDPLPGTRGALLDGVDIRLPRLVEVRGRVEDEKGVPLEVALEVQWELPPGFRPYTAMVPDRAKARVVSDGSFGVLLPERTRYILRVHSDLIRDASLEGTVPAAPGAGGPSEPAEPLVLKVIRGATISGRVVDASGLPVERGEIRVEPDPVTDRRTTKDASVGPGGVFTVGGLEPGRYGLAVLVHPEFLQELALGVEADGDPLTVKLRRPGGVTGRVLAPEDAPIGLLAEVSVRALGPTRPLPPEKSLVVPAGTVFRLGPLAPGPYAVRVLTGDRRLDIERVLVEDGGACDLGDLSPVDPTGIVEGTVRVAGLPAAGVSVEILRCLPEGRFRSVARTATGTGGTYRVARLEEGAHQVVVHPQDRPMVQAGFETVAGVPAKVDLEVPAGGRVTVRALDAEGRPLAGARVVIRGASGSLLFWKSGFPGPGPHTTGEDGVLHCSGVPAGEVRVIVDLPATGSGEASVSVADDGEETVDIRLESR